MDENLVSLAEAAKILGVHPATVRNWADRGHLPFQRTPGGHRRFRLSDLEQWRSQHQAGGEVEAQILVQSAMGRARMEIGEGQLAHAAWYQHLTPQARDLMSRYGRQLMELLRNYLTTGSDQLLQAAQEVGAKYAQAICAEGLKLSQAVEAFFVFHDSILDAVIQMMETGRGSHEWGDSVRHVHAFTHVIIMALVKYYEP